MTAHTPGPWKWSSGYETIDGRPTWSLVGEADGYGILSCDGEENSPQGMNDEANARLIAAAPELLEALMNASGVLQAFATQSQTAALCEEMARAAIAKAKGEPHA